MNVAPRFGSRGSRPLLIAIVALAATLASCGRSLPTTPVLPREAAPARASVTGRTNSADDLEDAVVTLAPGANAHEVCYDYDATLMWSGDGYARILPPPGETCEQLCAAMWTDPRVLSAERNSLIETAESRQESYASDDGLGSMQTYTEQPAADSLQLALAHEVSDGNGIRVAIIDTGVDASHPALYGHVTAGWDFVGGDANAADETSNVDSDGDGQLNEAYGHGTHVAGIVQLTAPRATILPVRVLDANGRGDISNVARGVRWAMDHGARVINLSLGMLRRSDAIQLLLEEAEARGIVVVCSAGNWGADNPTEFPASSSHAIAIGATHAKPRPADFTSYGSHLDLCAPGVGIRSAYPGGAWRLWSGTSMSTPFVAGTAALLLAVHPTWNAGNVQTRIEATTRTLVWVPPAEVGKLGSGALDVGAALMPDRTTLVSTGEPPAQDPTERRAR